MASLGQQMAWSPELASVALKLPPSIYPSHGAVAVVPRPECQRGELSPTVLPSHYPGIPIGEAGMVSNIKTCFLYGNDEVVFINGNLW